jgi:teichuronic acid biosynthesis glycosyltransferase TuaC
MVNKLRVLTFTSLYPNAAMPNFGVFVENRIRRVAETGEVDVRVVAPVPWFPSSRPMFGRYASWARVPRREIRHGLEVMHPRYPLVPKIGVLSHPLAMAVGAMTEIRRLRRRGFGFDLIDAHFYFPDGVAALLVGLALQRLVAITARGTDLSHYPQRHPLARRAIAWASGRAAASIVVSAALGKILIRLGAPPSRLHILPNGIDLDLFRPLDRREARRQLGVTGTVLASVGALIELKGHHLAIEALTTLPNCQLIIAGDGPDRRHLGALAATLEVASRVRFLGEVPHGELASVYSAADVLVLASSREGWPNVLLEAMACGTPVVATAVGGVPEMLTTPAAGRLVYQRNGSSLSAAVAALLTDRPDRAAARRHAELFSWDPTTRGQLAIFRAMAAANGAAHQSNCGDSR